MSKMMKETVYRTGKSSKHTENDAMVRLQKQQSKGVMSCAREP